MGTMGESRFVSHKEIQARKVVSETGEGNDEDSPIQSFINVEDYQSPSAKTTSIH